MSTITKRNSQRNREVGVIIENRLESLGLTVADLSRATRMPDRTLRRKIAGGTWYLQEIAYVATALDMLPSEPIAKTRGV